MLKKSEMFPVIDVFGKKIKFKGYYCTEKNRELCKEDCKKKVQVGLYIEVNKICNAHCKFCNIPSTQANNTKFDLKKFEKIFKELVERELLNRVAITGGEPFLTFEYLNSILDIIYKYSNNLLITINTNATNAYKITELHHLNDILGVNISRHHYDDKLNDEIFGCKTATREELIDISKRVPKHVMRLKCNLIKGYIDNIDEMKKYLEFATEINASNVGFVTLREENNFCKDNKIEINEFEKMNGILKVSNSHDRDCCECNNYVYMSDNGKFVNVFDRYIKKKSNDYCFQLVYSNNCLYEGFGKEIII